MMQSDTCHDCGCFKTINVIHRDGSVTTLMPGDWASADPYMVLQLEVICEHCERVYPYHSLVNPILLQI
jgi:hypothetical protein